MGLESRILGFLRGIFKDALYRGSIVLLVNTVAISVIGFIFWTLAAHVYTAAAVGVFSSITSGASLLAAVAGLGLSNTMTRYIVGATNPRELMILAVTAISTVGAILCFCTVLLVGPHLPPELNLRQHGSMILFVTVLVVFTAVGSTLDSGLIAIRSTSSLLYKNVIGSVAKLGLMLFLVSLTPNGLLISYSAGLVIAATLGGISLGRRIKGKWLDLQSFRSLRLYLAITPGNYIATIMGMLPSGAVPLEILVIRGAAQTAPFSAAFLVASFLNIIPSTVAQVLFAEVSREGALLGKHLRKAIRGIYALLLPPLVLLLPTAPFVLRLFGPAYAADATGCLRVLALSTLPAGGAYLVDSLLIARDRRVAYIFMQAANAALVLACVGILAPRGLTAAAMGWALAQSISLVLGLVVLATARTGRDRVTGAPHIESTVRQPVEEFASATASQTTQSQIRELLGQWPMMPTVSIAERIGWDQSIQLLLELVSEIRSQYLYADFERETNFKPGEVAHCGLWFAPVEIAAGSSQARWPQQFPVLTMISGYSKWVSATLLPSRRPEDLFCGLWRLINDLGSVPRTLVWNEEMTMERYAEKGYVLAEECDRFRRHLGTTVIFGKATDSKTKEIIERTHAHLECSFIRGRTFRSAPDFNAQLRKWLAVTNMRPRPGLRGAPARLIGADRQAMYALPSTPWSNWRCFVDVGRDSLVSFDSNYYSVHQSAIGRKAILVVDLDEVTVWCEGGMVAKHQRIWAHGQSIVDPRHRAYRG